MTIPFIKAHGARNDFQQLRFAGTIAACQHPPLTGLYVPTDIVENAAPASFECQVREAHFHVACVGLARSPHRFTVPTRE